MLMPDNRVLSIIMAFSAGFPNEKGDRGDLLFSKVGIHVEMMARLNSWTFR